MYIVLEVLGISADGLDSSENLGQLWVVTPF